MGRAVRQGGSVEQCGWLKDRYGVSWQIVPAVLMKYLGGPDAAGAQRAMQAMMQMVKLDIEGLRRLMRASRRPKNSFVKGEVCTFRTLAIACGRAS